MSFDARARTAAAVILGLVSCNVAIGMKQYFCVRSKRRRYDDSIRRVRRERQDKQHEALRINVEAEADGVEELTAGEMVPVHQKNSSKIQAHVVALAHRCRQHGRKEDAVNAVTEEVYDEAYEAGGELAKVNGNEDLVLFGVPISVKECISVHGTYSTCGLACRLANGPAGHDALIVQLLRDAGALPICCGNTMQTLMMAESVNNIWGRTRNPYNLSRSPGGSSGGDAALVAMGCVPVSVGNDIAGSIRIPASWNGLVGFKPTPKRSSNIGVTNSKRECMSLLGAVLPTVVGPIARSVEDCALFMKAVCVPKLWQTDTTLPPLPFDNDAYIRGRECDRPSAKEKPLRIGYFGTDGFFQPCKASRRALHESIEAVRAAGHECVPFEMPSNGWEISRLFAAILTAEGGSRSTLEGLEGEKVVPETALSVMGAKTPEWIRRTLAMAMPKRLSHVMTHIRCRIGRSAYEVWHLSAEVSAMRTAWSDAVRDADLDAIIFPTVPLPATPHGLTQKLTAIFTYVWLSNLLMWPSGTVPVTAVREDEQSYDMADIPVDQRDALAKLADEVMKSSAGLPIGVSVMTPAYMDERCLHVMNVIERGVGRCPTTPRAYLTATAKE